MSNLFIKMKNRIKNKKAALQFCNQAYQETLQRQIKIQNVIEGKSIYIHPDTVIEGKVIIKEGTRINGPAYIFSNKDNHVEIGKYCAIAHNLRIRINNHLMQYPNMQGALNAKCDFVQVHGIPKGNIIIGNAVWIGDDVMILPGVQIGNGAVIGARSVVTKDVPPFAVVAGNPSKVIKNRFDNKMIQFLEELKWWDWDDLKIAKNKLFFDTDLTESDVEKVKSKIV